MTDNNIVVIEKNSLMRGGLKNLLVQEGYQNILDFPQAQGAEFPETNTDLVLLGIDDSNMKTLEETLLAIKANFNPQKLVVLCSLANQEIIVQSFSLGVDGFIMKDILPSALLASLKLVMLGEKVFPSSMASLITREGPGIINNRKPSNFNKYSFSSREIEIIRCLADGESNKIIAKRLGISESTVKNHLKTILKKLGLSNRTKAAIWAVTNGLSSEPLQAAS